MKIPRKIIKAVAFLLTITTTLLPAHGFAQNSMRNTGLEAQALGESLARELRNTPAKVQNGIITVPTRSADGSLTYQGSDQFDVKKIVSGCWQRQQ